MNFATLGPEIPRIAGDTAPVRLLRWAVVATPDQSGNIIVSFNIAARFSHQPAVLLLAVEPYSLAPQSCLKVDQHDQRRIALGRVPSMLIDLAVSKVRELYHVGFPKGWSPH